MRTPTLSGTTDMRGAFERGAARPHAGAGTRGLRADGAGQSKEKGFF